MVIEQTTTFADLLRHFRRMNGLTQEELAARTAVSVRAISALERGISQAPRKETLALFAVALNLSAEDRTVFENSVRRVRSLARLPRASKSQQPAGRHTLHKAFATSLTPLIGREHEEATVTNLLKQSDIRLLTLTGIAGVGKTRLAKQVAAEQHVCFPDGVFFVSLAAIREPAQVLVAIAHSLGLQEGSDKSLAQRLITVLREQRLLLVLDNFEQVVAAAPEIVTLLESCPAMKALVTSRAQLCVRGEHIFAVPPLGLPDLETLLTEDDLGQYPAVALFVQRARAIKAGFTLTPVLAPIIAEICIRLDGLPLAIELAAAHIKLLPPHTMLARLHHQLSFLRNGAQDLLDHQRTMEGTIAWSYDLLDTSDQQLLQRLSVFVDGCTLETASAVGGKNRSPESTVLCRSIERIWFLLPRGPFHLTRVSQASAFLSTGV